ncbi:exported hypothetical protein [Streptomyces misionensis JCM 4497]
MWPVGCSATRMAPPRRSRAVWSSSVRSATGTVRPKCSTTGGRCSPTPPRTPPGITSGVRSPSPGTSAAHRSRRGRRKVSSAATVRPTLAEMTVMAQRLALLRCPDPARCPQGVLYVVTHDRYRAGQAPRGTRGRRPGPGGRPCQAASGGRTGLRRPGRRRHARGLSRLSPVRVSATAP